MTATDKTTAIVHGIFMTLALAAPAHAGSLVRADFWNPGTTGVADDGLGFDCSGDSVNDTDYADDRDTPCNGGNPEGVKSDVSGGGRWMLGIYGSDDQEPVKGYSPRGLSVNFSTRADGGSSSDIDWLLERAGITCDQDKTCKTHAWITVDRAFKKGANSDPISRFDLLRPLGPSGPEIRIQYVNPLYICDLGKDHRILTSWGCNQTDVAVHEADVLDPQNGVPGTVIGRWSLPFHADLVRVPEPSGGSGGGGDPGGGGCTYTGNEKGPRGSDGIDNDCNGVIDG